jgi:hypothetical protein
VGRQLDRIRPAKRERRLHQSLVAFRGAVEKVLPLVESAAALNDPVPLPQAIRSLIQFLIRLTNARDGVLLVRSHEPGREPAEICRVYDATGQAVQGPLAPFARSVAATAVSMAEPCAMSDLDRAAQSGAVVLQPFERGRRSLLAAPLAVAPGVHVVLELFDKQGPQADFTEADQRLVGAAADFGAGVLRQALAERQTHQVLLDAVAAALGAGESVAQSLGGQPSTRPDEPPPPAVLDRLRSGLRSVSGRAVEADATLRLAEAIRVLALRHGHPAVEYCIRLVEDLRRLLDTATGQTDTAANPGGEVR